jgi:hypothetical protein
MGLYKVIFGKNEIVSCRQESRGNSISGIYHYKYNKNHLLYALITSQSEEEAQSAALMIMKEAFNSAYGGNLL